MSQYTVEKFAVACETLRNSKMNDKFKRDYFQQTGLKYSGGGTASIIKTSKPKRYLFRKIVRK